MNRRVWTGILAGILAATVLLGVAGIAYEAGQRDEVVTRVAGDGEVVRVVGDRYGYGYGGYGHGWGHGGGYFLFPLLLTGLLVFLLVRAFRGGGGWGGGYGRGGGGCGPYQGDRFDERHRRAHDQDEPAEA